jgi:hypothetical protein
VFARLDEIHLDPRRSDAGQLDEKHGAAVFAGKTFIGHHSGLDYRHHIGLVMVYISFRRFVILLWNRRVPMTRALHRGMPPFADVL